MVELNINGNIIQWIQSFFIDQKVQLIINGYNNKEQDIKTKILQGSLVLPILFFIYISGVFDKVAEFNLVLTSYLL